MKQKVCVSAHAKINIGLDITGRRENGYHDVRMIMQTLTLCDTLTMERIPGEKLLLQSDCPGLPEGEDNLIGKAIRAVRELCSITEGVSVRLEKRIPVSAGLAGGSADAAAALKGMNELFELSLSQQALMELGLSLGADVPYCIMEGTALAEGVGELLTPLPSLPPCHILIAKPPFPVSTPETYAAYDRESGRIRRPDMEGLLLAVREGDLISVSSLLGNVLEAVTIKKYPVIDALKRRMRECGARNALMSGSGPSVYGLFTGEPEMERCRNLLLAEFPDCRLLSARPFSPVSTSMKE